MAQSAYRVFTGAGALLGALQGMSSAMRADILGPACIKAAGPVRTAAKRLAPKETGALRASIAIKGVSNRLKGTAAALVGPDRDYYRGSKRVQRGESRRGADRPANYAHLVEFGHVVVAPVKGTSRRKKTAKGAANGARFVPPEPFLRPAVVSAAPESERILIEEIGRGIDRERDKAIARGTHKS